MLIFPPNFAQFFAIDRSTAWQAWQLDSDVPKYRKHTKHIYKLQSCLPYVASIHALSRTESLAGGGAAVLMSYAICVPLHTRTRHLKLVQAVQACPFLYFFSLSRIPRLL